MERQWIEVSFTSGSLDEARKIARALVKERLVACAQITPWIESIYLWNQQMETTQESKVTMKTAAPLFKQVSDYIQKNCSYEVPEITARLINEMSPSYETWLGETINSPQARINPEESAV